MGFQSQVNTVISLAGAVKGAKGIKGSVDKNTEATESLKSGIEGVKASYDNANAGAGLVSVAKEQEAIRSLENAYYASNKKDIDLEGRLAQAKSISEIRAQVQLADYAKAHGSVMTKTEAEYEGEE